MGSFGKCIRVAAVILCGELVAGNLALGQGATSRSQGKAKERARVVLSKELPTLDGKHLKAILVEVDYGPGRRRLHILIPVLSSAMSSKGPSVLK